MSEQRRKILPVVAIRPPLSTKEEKDALNVNRNEDGSFNIDLGKGNIYRFPKVYGFKADDLNELCRMEVQPLLDGVLDGESGAIICYGETYSGKSYLCGTECFENNKKMSQNPNSIGSYLSRRIFEMTKGLKSVDVECSMIEIYRESSSSDQVFDLLDGFSRKKLLQQYGKGLAHQVSSPSELFNKLIDGAALRNTDRTDGNARSSRSHAIFTIQIQHTRPSNDNNKKPQRVRGKIMLVDLAGAESAVSPVGSQQQKQGSGINVGLSTLQTVIHEVAEYGTTVQYRSSKLTYMLKPALGGSFAGGKDGCNVVFIGCLLPISSPNSRSKNTLSFMQKAAQIQNTVRADVQMVESKAIENLEKERDSLLEQVRVLADEMHAMKHTSTLEQQQQRVVVLSVEEYDGLIAQIDEYKDKITALEIILQDADEKYKLLLEENLRASPQHQSDTERQEEESMLKEERKNTTPAPTQLINDLKERPRLAALAITPILAAAQSINKKMSKLSARNSTLIDPATSLSQLVSAEFLTADDIILPLHGGDSHLEPQQFKVLKSLVEQRLEKKSLAHKKKNQKDSTSDAGNTNVLPSGVDCALVESVLLQRTKEIEALRLSISAYDECLGDLAARLELTKLREIEVSAQLLQAASEKVQYVDLTAKFSQALDISQADVSALIEELSMLKKSKNISI